MLDTGHLKLGTGGQSCRRMGQGRVGPVSERDLFALVVDAAECPHGLGTYEPVKR
jgi:hypothetical protein